MDQQPGSPSEKPRKQPGGYGKRPVWQWVVIYIVVGLVVYGLIYYLFMRGETGY